MTYWPGHGCILVKQDWQVSRHPRWQSSGMQIARGLWWGGANTETGHEPSSISVRDGTHLAQSCCPVSWAVRLVATTCAEERAVLQYSDLRTTDFGPGSSSITPSRKARNHKNAACSCDFPECGSPAFGLPDGSSCWLYGHQGPHS